MEIVLGLPINTVIYSSQFTLVLTSVYMYKIVSEAPLWTLPMSYYHTDDVCELKSQFTVFVNYLIRWLRLNHKEGVWNRFVLTSEAGSHVAHTGLEFIYVVEGDPKLLF